MIRLFFTHFFSRRTARDFDTRPGLKYLLMKVSGVCGAANLYRQSAMSFNLYFQALLCATLSQADSMTAQQVGTNQQHVTFCIISSTFTLKGVLGITCCDESTHSSPQLCRAFHSVHSTVSFRLFSFWFYRSQFHCFGSVSVLSSTLFPAGCCFQLPAQKQTADS